MGTFLRLGARIVFALFVATFTVHAAMAERRVALVIGNAKYEHADALTNTVNDANAIAAVLTKAGFDVVDERRDVGVVEFKRAVRDFVAAAANADIVVVYYSGHGIEVGGTNYLIPVDAKLASDFDIEDEAIALDRIITASQSAKRLSLIILDACRDNPFLHAAPHATATRSFANRLVGVQPAGADTLIAYAAKAGSVSYDGLGSNSPFTTALVKYIAEPGLDIRIALGKVRDDVLASTGNRQEPFVYGSLGGADISLVPAPEAPVRAPIAVDPNVAMAHEYEMAERVGARQAWESFLTVHSTGFYADLARAQLAKLIGVEPAKLDSSAKANVEINSPPAAPRAQTEAAQPKVEHQAALQPKVDVAAPTPLVADQACKRDEARLTRLRGNPSLEQVAQFARELGCENLRPQVQRLAESLGATTVATLETKAIPRQPNLPDSTAASEPLSKPTAQDSQAVCKREEGRLAKLRGDASMDQVAQFARELSCEDLRPQVQRLLESLGAEPALAAAQPATAAPGPQSRGVTPQAPPPDDPQVCKRDAAELAHVRANPDRASVLRFETNLRCEDLRPQVARLLESLDN
jgi:Caspase domain